MPSSNARWYRAGESLIVLSLGDITAWSGDALVNAANERMLGGGGVDGAIHRAAGPKLREACEQVAEVKPGVRCPTGEARITRAGRLQVKYVIHTVGPVYQNEEESAPLLAAAYKSSLQLANKHRLENVAFPAISTAVYGYPPEEAGRVALSTVAQHAGNVRYIEFVLFPEKMFDVFVEAAGSVAGLEAMPSATPQVSDPPQPQEQEGGEKREASLHLSSQGAQPTASNSQSGSVCGGGGGAREGGNEVQSAQGHAPVPSAGNVPSGPTASGAGPSGLTAPSGTASGGPMPSRR